jgi:glucose-6-phosphate isomerase
MFNQDNFFTNYVQESNKYNLSLKKTKKICNTIIKEIKNKKNPLFETFKQEYEFDFSNSLVKKISKYENIIIIGVGGSILGSKCIYSFCKKKIKKNFYFFDNLDLNLHLEYKKIKNLNRSCFIVISKSGNTLETITNLKELTSKSSVKGRLVIITEIKNSLLMSFAKKYDAKIIEHKKYIGGRYSVLSETGMFPAAIMGLKLKRFKSLKNLINNKNFIKSLIKNVASIYTLNSNKINNSIILNYDSDLNDLGFWYQQLVAESLGKKGKGINPILSICPKDHHSLLQLYIEGSKDKFFTFFTSSNKKNNFKNTQNVIKAQANALKNIFKIKKIPFRNFDFNNKNEDEIGKIFLFFFLETIILARLMNVNPFNQPAVEQVKIETKKLLG